MSAARRALWCVILGTWPAVIAAKAMWHPGAGNLLSDCGAALTVAAGTVLLVLGPGRVPDLRDWRRKRQILELRAAGAVLAARLDEHEAAAAKRFTEVDARIAGLFSVMDEARQKLGVSHPDLDMTLPDGVYQFPRKRQAI